MDAFFVQFNQYRLFIAVIGLILVIAGLVSHSPKKTTPPPVLVKPEASVPSKVEKISPQLHLKIIKLMCWDIF